MMGSDRFWRGVTWVTFAVVMAGFAYLVRMAVGAWSWWFTVPALAAIFAFGFYLDKRAGRY